MNLARASVELANDDFALVNQTDVRATSARLHADDVCEMIFSAQHPAFSAGDAALRAGWRATRSTASGKEGLVSSHRGKTAMIRLLAMMLVVQAAVSSALAQTAPAGWEVSATKQAWVATSPAQANGDRVRIVFYPVVKARGELDAWFDGQVAQRTKGLGMMIYQDPAIGREVAPPLSPLLRRVAALSRFGQARSTIAANFGYETGEGRQFVQVIMPAWPGKPRADYLAAVEQVAAGWRAGVVYRQSAAALSKPATKDQ